jgi:hypothetical protein
VTVVLPGDAKVIVLLVIAPPSAVVQASVFAGLALKGRRFGLLGGRMDAGGLGGRRRRGFRADKGYRGPRHISHKGDGAEPIASDAVNEIPDNLCSDDRDRESPSQKAASKPSDSCRGESRTEQREENPNRTAQRRELLVRSRIESPETIKSRALPRQSSCSETRHNRTKEQENAYCSESRRLSPESESLLAPAFYRFFMRQVIQWKKEPPAGGTIISAVMMALWPVGIVFFVTS